VINLFLYFDFFLLFFSICVLCTHMHIWVYKNTKGMGFGIGDWWVGIGPGGGRGTGGRQRPTHKTCKYDCRPSRSSSISVLLCTRRVWRHNVSFRMCVYLTDTNCVDIDTSNRPSSGDQCTQLFLLPRLAGIPCITRLGKQGMLSADSI